MNVYITGQWEKPEQWQCNDFENLFCLSFNTGIREGGGELANFYCIF